jgi:hypothetical protein
MASDCFTDDQRIVMKDHADKVKTLESINKLLAKAEDHLRKNKKAAKSKEHVEPGLGITQEEVSEPLPF